MNVAHRPAAEVTITVIAQGDSGTLANLLQLYQYDFSEIEPSDVATDGRFHQLDDVAFQHGYLIHVDGALAGFALVNREPSRVVGGEAVWWMAEFFILRRFRRASIGARAAHLVIDAHPGTWEITQTPRNAIARSFWQKVLAPFGGQELLAEDPIRGRRPLQRFSR